MIYEEVLSRDPLGPPAHWIEMPPDVALVSEVLAELTKLFPHVVRSEGDRHECVAWCGDTFGINGRVYYQAPNQLYAKLWLNPDAVWAHTGSFYTFKNQDDAFAFKMRWG